MTDNATITPGSGLTVGADDVGGVLMQRVKPVWGPDGTATDVDVAAPLPVQDRATVLTGSASSATTVVGPFDASSFAQIIISTTGTYTATVVLQGSLDQSTWTTVNRSTSLYTGPNVSNSSLTTGSQVRAIVLYPYYRLQVTAYTSGTVNATLHLTRTSPIVVATGDNGNVVVQATALNNTNSDAASSPWVMVAQAGYNGANWDRLRTPTTFKSATATASGNTTVWTPGASKKFRLMRYKIDVSQDAAQASGGVITIGLQDNTTDMGMSQSVFVPATAATTMGAGWTSGWIDLGNGRISSTINLVMNVNLSAALTSGTVRVITAGVEE